MPFELGSLGARSIVIYTIFDGYCIYILGMNIHETIKHAIDLCFNGTHFNQAIVTCLHCYKSSERPFNDALLMFMFSV